MALLKQIIISDALGLEKFNKILESCKGESIHCHHYDISCIKAFKKVDIGCC